MENQTNRVNLGKTDLTHNMEHIQQIRWPNILACSTNPILVTLLHTADRSVQ